MDMKGGQLHHNGFATTFPLPFGADIIEAVLQHIADGGSQDLPAGYSVDDNLSHIMRQRCTSRMLQDMLRLPKL
jgi:hypothetical protein